MKNILIAFFVGVSLGFVIFYSPQKEVKPIERITEIPGPVQIKTINKYIPVESKVDLTPLYTEIDQLKQERDGLLEFLEELCKSDTTIHPPVVPDRPIPQIAFKKWGLGLWPGVAASLNYENDKLTPSGYLTMQYLYVWRFTAGIQANNKEAGLNLGYHVPMFRNLQVKALVNKRFSGSSVPDNYGVGLGLNF